MSLYFSKFFVGFNIGWNFMKIEKLYPICKDYVWGGNKLIAEYGKTKK